MKSLVFKADYKPALDRLIDCLLENCFSHPGDLFGISDIQPLQALLKNKRHRYVQEDELRLVAELDGIAEKLAHR
ncbi:hypothetical protein OAM69_06070 [bacterium]|nr:hypothetical protein [bacterium]